MRRTHLQAFLFLGFLLLAACGGTGTPAQHTVDAQTTTTAQALQAPKHPQPTTASCPEPSSGPAAIIPHSTVDPDAAPTVYFTNGAEIPPSQGNPFSYLIIAGALKTNPQQGVLAVSSQPQDSCAQGPIGQFHVYNSPFQQGALTLTHINGDTVSFTPAADGIGQFNYLTGQFS